MSSFYEDGDAEGALTQRGASKTVITKKALARVSLMMSHIERCYAEEATHKEYDEVLALGIYRTLALTTRHLRRHHQSHKMVYQDMFRGKEGDQGRIMH
jgi:hypothetical protein